MGVIWTQVRGRKIEAIVQDGRKAATMDPTPVNGNIEVGIIQGAAPNTDRGIVTRNTATTVIKVQAGNMTGITITSAIPDKYQQNANIIVIVIVPGRIVDPSLVAMNSVGPMAVPWIISMRGADPEAKQDAVTANATNPRTDQVHVTMNAVDPEAALDTLTETVRGNVTQKYLKNLALYWAVEGMENVDRKGLDVGHQNPASQPTQVPIQSKDDVGLRSFPTPASIGPGTNTSSNLMEAKSLPLQTSVDQPTDHKNGLGVPTSLTPHVLNSQARKNGMSLQPGSHRLHDPRKRREQQHARRDQKPSDSCPEQLKGSSKQKENDETGSLSVRTGAQVSGDIKKDGEEPVVIFKGAAKEQLVIAKEDIVQVDNNTVSFEQARNSSVPATILTLPATDASPSALTSASASTPIPKMVQKKRIKIRR